MWPLLEYIDFRCFIFLATMKNLPPVGANLTENDPRTPIFLFHFWNPDNFSILYVKFEENLMDFKNGPNTVNVIKSWRWRAGVLTRVTWLCMLSFRGRNHIGIETFFKILVFYVRFMASNDMFCIHNLIMHILSQDWGHILCSMLFICDLNVCFEKGGVVPSY